MDTNNLLSAIKKKYLSFEKPTYFFVNKAIAQKPYLGIIETLQEAFDLKDITDVNYDVCFRYSLEKNSEKFILELSMVGAYAVVLLSTSPNKCVLLHTSASECSNIIFSTLRENSVSILNRPQLEIPCDIKLINAPIGKTFMYQALFSDTTTLPWLV